jgi:hypothetical protein
MTGAAQLYVAVANSLDDGINPHAFKVYRDRLLRDAGEPTDPIEVMLIEQIAMAHFHIGRLYMKSCATDNHKLSSAYGEAATRLLGEFRRCTLALEDFRAKQAARKERSATVDVTASTVDSAGNGAPNPSANGNGSTNGRKRNVANELDLNSQTNLPECLQNRMSPPATNGSKLVAATGGKGTG